MKKSKIIDYDVESTIGLDDLIKRVNRMIQEGWQPTGWCTLGTNKRGNTIYSQTLVKYNRPKKNKIVEYYVMYSTNLGNLIFRVNVKIDEGWQPTGNCEHVVNSDSKKDFYQTMLLYEGMTGTVKHEE